MFGASILVGTMPSIINKLKEKEINESLVKLAISKGYKISRNTPIFLFKYDDIVELFLRDDINASYLNQSDLVEVLRNCSKYRDVVQFAIDNIDQIYDNYSLIFDGYYEMIPVNEEYKKLFNNLGVKYLKFNPVFLYSDYFSGELDNDSLKYVIQNKIDVTRIKVMSNSLYISLMDSYPSLLKRSGYESAASDYVLESIINKKIKIEDIVDTKYFGMLFKDLLDFDLSCLKYVPKLNSIYYSQVIDNLVNNIDVNYIYLEEISRLIDEYTIKDEDRRRIMNALNSSSNVVVRGSVWNFVLEDENLIVNSILRDPSSLNTMKTLYDISAPNISKIFEAIKKSNNIVITKWHYFYNKNGELARYVISKNPYIIQNSDYITAELAEFAKECGYEANFGSDYGMITDDDMLELIKSDEDILFRFRPNDNLALTKQMSRIALDKGISLKKSPMFNYPYVLVNQLLNGTTSSNFYSQNEELNRFLLSNGYLNDNNSRSVSFRNDYSYRDLFALLEEDFSKILDMYYSLDDVMLKRLSDLYFKDYSNNSKYFDESYLLKNNPYIIARELVEYEVYRNVNDKIRDIVSEEICKYPNLEINENNIRYIRDGNRIFDYIKEHVEELDYLDFDIFSKEQIDALSLICLENNYGEYSYIFNSDFIVEHFAECIFKCNLNYIITTLARNIDDKRCLDCFYYLINNHLCNINNNIMDLLPEEIKNDLVSKNPWLFKGLRRIDEDKVEDANPFNPMISYLYKEGTISKELYDKKHQELRDYVLAGNLLSNNFSVDINTSEGIDYELLEYISLNNHSTFINLLIDLENVDDRVANIIKQFLSNASLADLRKIFNYGYGNIYSDDVKNILVAYLKNNAAKLGSSLLTRLSTELVKCLSVEEYYALWKNSPNVKVNNQMLSNPLILGELVSKDKSIIKKFDGIYDKNLYYVVYDLYKNADLNLYVKDSFFYNNPLLVAKLLGEEYTLGDRDKKMELMYKLILRYPDNVNIYIDRRVLKYSLDNGLDLPIDKFVDENSYLSTYSDYIEALLDKDFERTIVRLGDSGCRRFMNLIISKALEINYVINEKTPKLIMKNNKIQLNSIKVDDSSIRFIYPYLTGIEKTEVLSAINKYHILGVFIYPLVHDKEYVLESLKSNPELIDKFPANNYNSDLVLELQSLYLKYIKEGLYVVNKYTPKFLFYKKEIYDFVKLNNPELLEGFFVRDCEISKSKVDEALNNLDRVDEILGEDRYYSLEELKPLVDKLILSNYIVSDKTPKCLLYDYNFLYYAIKNNMVNDDQLLKRFINFEGLYVSKDIELFKAYFLKGYFRELIPFASLYGLEKALELGTIYGKYLYLARIGNSKDLDGLFKDITSVIAFNTELYDFYIRSDDLENILDKVEYLDKDYLLSLLLFNKKKNESIIIKLIKGGCYFPKESVNDAWLIDLFVKNSNKLSIVSDLLNKCNLDLLDDRSIFRIIELGYLVTSSTPKKLLQDDRYLIALLVNEQNINNVFTYVDKVSYEVVKFALNRYKNKVCIIGNTYLKDDLDDRIVRLLIDNGYYINSNSPDIIKSNATYIKLIISHSNYNELISTILNNNCKFEDYIDQSDIDYIIETMFEHFEIKGNIKELSFEDKYRKLVKIITDWQSITTVDTANVYFKYALQRIEHSTLEELDKVKDFVFKLEKSNSSEIRKFASTLLDELLKVDDYEKAYEEVERIFVKNNLPVVGKIFSVFKVLHADYEGFINRKTHMSPVLKQHGTRYNDSIIFGDLLKCAIGSNNRSLRDYINNLMKMVPVLEGIEKGLVDYDSLDDESKEELRELIEHLYTSYNNTYSHRINKLMLKSKENIIDSIRELRILFTDTLTKDSNYSFTNRVIRMFCYSIGFSSLEELISYSNNAIRSAHMRNIEASSQDLVLEEGDLIKGLNSYNYIGTILQNGSVSKEFLGDSADSDYTPLDTDLSLVVHGGTFNVAVNGLEASGYGPVWIVLKKGPRFQITRDSDGDKEFKLDRSKLELFSTGGPTHYGIRTGFASSEINCFVVENYEDRLGLEIAINGFYIPVYDRSGKLVYSIDDFMDLRNKMSGLGYLDTEKYQIASVDELTSPRILEFVEGIVPNRKSIVAKHKVIQSLVVKAAQAMGMKFKDKFDADVSSKVVELVDTGSTARATDLPGKADFDYICRIDRELFLDSSKYAEFRNNIINGVKSYDNVNFLESHNKLAIDGAIIEGIEGPVDIEISFVIKTNKLEFSSEESLRSRLEGIKKGECIPIHEDDVSSDYSSRYPLVLANILMAKALFKKFECYKKHGSNPSQGGLGGIGIENWILQHGGSLKRACEDFIKVSSVCNSYEEFKKRYHVWDFGENHYAIAEGNYAHDEFVYKNMDSSGYERMKKACECYLTYGDKALTSEELEEVEAETKSL